MIIINTHAYDKPDKNSYISELIEQIWKLYLFEHNCGGSGLSSIKNILFWYIIFEETCPSRAKLNNNKNV